jgi:hypothetical protein
MHYAVLVVTVVDRWGLVLISNRLSFFFKIQPSFFQVVSHRCRRLDSFRYAETKLNFESGKVRLKMNFHSVSKCLYATKYTARESKFLFVKVRDVNGV